MKDQTLRDVVIVGFLLTVILQVFLMLKQYEIEQIIVQPGNGQAVQMKSGAVVPGEDCQMQGMLPHFSERTGQYDGCVPPDYMGM